MLHHISQNQFIKQLKTRKLENISVIQTIEKSLKEQRGFAFRMPKSKSPVILLLSGGLDSVTSWGILMKEFGLNVYPLSFDRGEKRASKEKESIDFFSSYYQKRFPDLYHKPHRLTLGINDIFIPIEHCLQHIHPDIILKNFTGTDRLIGINLSFASFLLLPVYAKIYAEYIHHVSNLRMRTIFCSVTFSDGILVPHQTFTSIRSIMYYLCAATGDFSWQFTSAVFEKENGLCFEKSDLAKWTYDHHIPIEKTWSCYHSKMYQCGGSDCQTCLARKAAFLKAKIPDKTIYRPLSKQSVLGNIKYLIRRVLSKIDN